MTSLLTTHDRVLWRLEQEELRGLAWGRVDGVMTDAELAALCAEELPDPNERTRVIEELIELRLLLDVGDRDALWRTRFGESARLLARNRQLMPNRPWRAAAPLVNDYRIVARPRAYPRRNVPLMTFLEHLGSGHPLGDGERRALTSMLTGVDGTLDLAQFQVDASRRIRDELHAGSVAGTVVSAGTGSGKTKAFYLPALGYIAGNFDATRWARVLAMYPRNELLKDQLSEALAQVELIAAAGGPIIAVGAFFGPTVAEARYVATDAKEAGGGWRPEGTGFACTYLRCPLGCGNEVVWAKADLQVGREIVRCPRCDWESRTGQVVLTREAITARAPHLLFTTTEMLNRGLADARFRPTFVGASAATRPRALLLDEVHTYGGVHGAQVALLLRRWRHALGARAPLHIVGLSATLEAPAAFLALLTGIADAQAITPQPTDMRERAAEYGMVLRGNPVSGSALLSTTIQTAFLLERLLESRNLRDRTSTSGSRLFAFTDNLDVTNRLFWDLRDAERGRRGRPPLASLRADAGQSDREARDRDGQIWRLPPQLGWALGPTDRLQITRTSSQDTGVDFRSDVVVATASLEVGFDDPEVGAVIQHKAPRDDAAFVQRKGRAGRQLSMRPWTVVVLSDYGKDRVSYQAYESLFAPTLRASTLPLDNAHVLKMQAAYALLDWLLGQVPGLRSRSDLSARAKVGSDQARRQTAVAHRLRAVLADPRVERALERHIRFSLQLSSAQSTQVMWQPPRAVMTDVVPTLLRRLECDWKTAANADDLLIRDTPLPEHAPQALFSDLNLPEVEIEVPHRDGRPPRTERLSVAQALGEFVPGRASRRYGVERIDEWHWVPLPEPDEAGKRDAEISDWVPMHQPAGAIALPGETSPRPVLRPWRMQLSLAGVDERKGNARPVWCTTLESSGPAWLVAVPHADALRSLLPELQFYTHALRSEVTARRAIATVNAELGDGVEVEVNLLHAGRPAALGFVADVDAVRLPVQHASIPSAAALSPEARRAAWTAWFERTMLEDPYLRAHASSFAIGWLVVLYLAALAALAIGDDLSDLRASVQRIRELGLNRCLERALEAVFTVNLEDEDESRGITRLRALIDDQSAMSAIDSIAARLVAGDPAELNHYLRRAGLATVGAAVREAFQRMAPTFDAENLVIDLVVDAGATAQEGEAAVWLSEPDVGSGGTIEELRRLAAEDPSRLSRLVTAAVGPTDLEVTGWATRRALDVSTQGPLAEAFAAVRKARSLGEGAAAQATLRAALRQHGLPTDHAVMATLNLRILRPGSSPATDQLTSDALTVWERAEARLGLEIDARAVAYALSRQEAYSLEDIYSLLWPRGTAARRAGLDAYSRFTDDLPIERLLFDSALGDRVETIELADDTLLRLPQVLADSGRARLRAPVEQAGELRAVVQRMLTTAIDVGSVAGYARVLGVRRLEDLVEVEFELPEAAA